MRYESPGGEFSVRLGGRLHGDVASIDYDDGSSQTDEEWRRARLSVSGKLFGGDWRYRYEHDFAADSDQQIKDAWIGYSGFDRIRLRAGNQQEPVSLEELTSSNGITFMERALPNALVPGYHLGVLALGRGEQWNAAGGLFEGTIRGRERETDEGWGIAGRAVYTPVDDAGNRLHAGVSVAYREPPGDAQVRYSSRPEVHLSDRRLVSTGTLSDVDYTLTSGLELAGVRGPWSLQGEYLRADVRRSGRPDVTFDGWYLMGSWFVTGGRRDYDRRTGSFDPVRPQGRLGAWELALRYSVLDLQDGPITGGEERNWTVGLNWYVDTNVRLMLNWVDARADPNSDGEREHLQAVQFRFQFAF
jgi:phosphate-selective porin OprO/OprP